MNPLTNVKNITKLNEIELASGLIHKKSWHDMYKDSAWIFIGGLAYALTEGDILAVFSQYGEIVNLNLVRDKKTGKSKGFCFLCYANQKSTILAVDNLNAIKLCSRTIRVDHVANYKPPKEDDRDDEITKMLKSEGCAPKQFDTNENNETSNGQAKKKKAKKEKKEKKKKKRKHSSDERDSGNEISGKTEIKVKKEKIDSGYDKYDISLNKTEDKEKQKHQKRNCEQSHIESSHSHEKFTSKSDQLCDSSSKRNSAQYDDKYLNKHRAKDRSESEYHHKEVHKESDREHASLSRNVRRERSMSSSSVDSSRNHKQSVYCKSQTTQSKSKHSDSKRKLRESKQNSSSSSDEDSSSHSSSEDEKHKTKSENSKRDKYKRYDEKKSFHVDRRDKYDHRSEKYDYKSHRTGHYGKTERDFDYRSKNKYGSDDKDNNNHKDSHHRGKHDRR